MRVYDCNTHVNAFSLKECRINVVDKISILTPLSDLFTDLIFSSWSLINKCNNLYVSMCVMGPFNYKIKFNQDL